MIVFSLFEQEVTFQFKSNIRFFRLRRNKKDRGTRVVCSKTVILSEGEKLFFDNFE